MPSRREAQITAAQDATEKEQLTADTLLQQIKAMTPEQAATYVNNNTATLAQTRIILKTFARALVILARQIK